MFIYICITFHIPYKQTKKTMSEVTSSPFFPLQESSSTSVSAETKGMDAVTNIVTFTASAISAVSDVVEKSKIQVADFHTISPLRESSESSSSEGKRMDPSISASSEAAATAMAVAMAVASASAEGKDSQSSASVTAEEKSADFSQPSAIIGTPELSTSAESSASGKSKVVAVVAVVDPVSAATMADTPEVKSPLSAPAPAFDGNYSKYIGKTMSGVEFNQIFKNRKFVKFTNESEIHNGFKFQDGLNVDTVPFCPRGKCKPGGLYFCDYETDGGHWTYYNHVACRYYRMVQIPDNKEAQVYFEQNKIKASHIILGERKGIWECDELFSMSIKVHDLKLIKYIDISTVQYFNVVVNFLRGLKWKDDEIYFRMVADNPSFLEFVPENYRNAEMCETAVTFKPALLKWVPKQLDTHCKKALAADFAAAIPYVEPRYLTMNMFERAEKMGILHTLTPNQMAKKQEFQRKRAQQTGMIGFVGTCALVAGVVIGVNAFNKRTPKSQAKA